MQDIVSKLMHEHTERQLLSSLGSPEIDDSIFCGTTSSVTDKPLTWDDIKAAEKALEEAAPAPSVPVITERQIHIAHPHKTFKYVKLQSKSKVGRRYVKVKKFNGWQEVMNDGEVIYDKQRNIFMMNLNTRYQVIKAIESDKRLNPAYRQFL